MSCDLDTVKRDFDAQIRGDGPFGQWLSPRLEHLQPGLSRLSLDVRAEFLREGGTVSGPILMGLADIAMYAAVMSVSENGRHAATSDMTLHFLRRPAADRLLAEATVLKAGRRLVVLDVLIWAEGDDRPVCHIAGSYALPAK